MIKKVLLSLGYILLMTWFIMGTSNYVKAVTASYNQTVEIVDSLGNVINGTASATTASPNQVVRVVNSTGNVLDSFGAAAGAVAATKLDEEGTITNGGTVTCGTVAGAGWNVCHFTLASPSTSVTIANPVNLPTNALVYIGYTAAAAGTMTNTWGTHFFAFQPGVGNETISGDSFFNGGLATFGVGGLAWTAWWSDGTNVTALPGGLGALAIPGNINTTGTITTRAGLTVGNSSTLTLNTDNPVSSMSRMPLTFAYGAGSVVTATNFAVYKVVRALTIENYEGSYAVGASCSNPVIRIYDCGASAPTNANCSGGTQLATVTLTATVGSTVDGTINSANVAAGEYIGAQIQASGSCTTFSGSVTAMARPQ